MQGESGNPEKSLGLLDVYARATGATLSAGLFLLPGLAARQAGAALVPAYLLAVIPLVPAMMCTVELMTAMPRAGGIYFFLDRSLGPLAGTVGGLGTWLVLILKVSLALVGVGAYLTILFPELPVVPVALVLTLLAAAVNVYGGEITGTAQVLLLGALLSVLALFVAVGLPAVEAGRFADVATVDSTVLLSTAGLLYVSYVGLTRVASVAEEVEEPERNLPMGVFLSIGTAVIVYGLGATVIVGVLPMEQLQGDLTSAASAGEVLLGPAGALAVAGAALISFAAAAEAGTRTATRYPLAMSRDRIFPAFFDRIGARGTPSRAISLTGGLMACAVLLLDPIEIAKLASAFQLLVFALICLAVIVMRESRIQEYEPGYSAPWYPWLQIVGMVAPTVLILEMGLWTSLFSVGLVVTGGVWYWSFVRGSAEREGAIYHLFDRLGEQRYEGLEEELREILREKGLREADPYGEMLGRAQVIEIAGSPSFEEVVRRASERLSRTLPATAERLTETFLEETQLGVTPIAHGAALPHVRLEGMESPHLLLVRSREGLELERGERPDEGDDGGRRAGRGGRRVHAIFFLVSPEGDPRQHLRMLAKLADHIQEEGFLEQWLAADGEHELKEVMLRDERIVALHVERDRTSRELIGRRLRDLDLPEEVLPTLIRRDDAVEVPDPGTVLREGDCVTLLGTPEGVREVRERFQS